MVSKDIIKECAICHRQFINPKKGEIPGQVCKSCRTNYRKLKIKTQCVEYLGGKCEICGYDKNVYVLDFHHKDPSQKDFNISESDSNFEKLKPELDKCMLLCANCHRELHYKLKHKDNILG